MTAAIGAGATTEEEQEGFEQLMQGLSQGISDA
jgi:hypothetical protein